MEFLKSYGLHWEPRDSESSDDSSPKASQTSEIPQKGEAFYIHEGFDGNKETFYKENLPNNETFYPDIQNPIKLNSEEPSPTKINFNYRVHTEDLEVEIQGLHAGNDTPQFSSQTYNNVKKLFKASKHVYMGNYQQRDNYLSKSFQEIFTYNYRKREPFV